MSRAADAQMAQSRWGVLALLLFIVMPAGTVAQQSLLRQSDVGAFAPATFQARLSITRGGDTSEVEIYRASGDRTLLRFLAAKERGKFLLRRGADLWLIAPDAKKPVKLGPSHRIYGAATTEVLFSLHLADDYNVHSTTSEATSAGTLTVFELRAKSPTAPFAEVRYAVDPATARPASALYRARSGKPLVQVAFQAWSANNRHAIQAALAARWGRAASNSLHVQGKAVDVRRPGLHALGLVGAAWQLARGGVGLYRGASPYVHLDTGPRRRW